MSTPTIAPLPLPPTISPLPIAPPVPGANNIVPFRRPVGDEPSISTVKPSDVAQFPSDLAIPKSPGIPQSNLIKQAAILGGKIAAISQIPLDDIPGLESPKISRKQIKNARHYTLYEITWNTLFNLIDRKGKPYTHSVLQSQAVWGPITGYTETQVPKLNYFSSHQGRLSYGPVIFCGGPWLGLEQTKQPSDPEYPDYIWAWGFNNPPLSAANYKVSKAVLKDNSKMRVYLDSEAKSLAYIKNLLSSYVDPAFFPSRRFEDFIQIGIRPQIKKVTLYPRKADYYSMGVHKNVTPEKSYTFIKSDKG